MVSINVDVIIINPSYEVDVKRFNTSNATAVPNVTAHKYDVTNEKC